MIDVSHINDEINELGEALDLNFFESMREFMNSIYNFERAEVIKSKKEKLLKSQYKYTDLESDLLNKWLFELDDFYLNKPGLFTGEVFFNFSELLDEDFITVDEYELINFPSKEAKGKLVLSPEIKMLEHQAFSFCNLNEIVLSPNIEVIPSACFYGAEKLKRVTIGKNLKTIGIRAFTNSGIEEIFLPEGVTKIEPKAFMNCKSLVRGYIPSTVKEIEMFVFSNTEIKSVGRVDSKVNRDYHLEISGSLEDIKENAFLFCFDLETVNLPDVKKMSNTAFQESEIENFNISPSCKIYS